MASDQPQSTPGQDSPHAQRPPLTTLTDEERQIMKECERESFYLRGLPLSAGAMVGAHVMVKSGKWVGHPRFGSIPKAVIFGGMAYFIGKISYLPTCQQKILDRIPNSNLAAAIRKSRGMGEPDASAAAFEDSSAGSGESQSKYKEDYSALEGLDDRFRPSVDREIREPKSAPEEKPGMTYEELRKRNRQEYEDQLSKRPPPPPGTPSYKDSPYMPQRPWPEKSRPAPGDTDLESPAPSPSPPPSGIREPKSAPEEKPGMTYEELRKCNRQEYEDQLSKFPDFSEFEKRTNIWGDVIE